MVPLSKNVARFLPVFKVWADDCNHPSVALNKPVCVIGRREEGVNLPLQAPQVSKLHAMVVRSQRHVYVRDLASRNGVQRNGALVQEVGLADEDVLRVGSYTLRCASGFGGGDGAAEDTGAATDVAGDALPPAELVGPDGAAYPFPAGQHTVLIGHRDGCDVQLDGDDDGVAPVHAIVFEMDGTRYVRDLGAPAGTLLNRQPVHQSTLKPGDEIGVGSVTLRYALVEISAEDMDNDVAPDMATDTVEKQAAITRDALGVDDSAPGIELVDSVTTDPNLSTGDSMMLPEITMEDSRTPATAGPRAASPISEYDMDVIDADPRRESTFAGEVVAEGAANVVTPDDVMPANPQSDGVKPGVKPDGVKPDGVKLDVKSDSAKSDSVKLDVESGGVKRAGVKRADAFPADATPADAKPARPPVPPVTAASVQRGLDDSSIPIAGSFHDQILDDQLLQDGADPHAKPARTPTTAIDAPGAGAGAASDRDGGRIASVAVEGAKTRSADA